ncbi:MAG: ferritin-like domain-containing protein [Candidatus Eremiobacteraeota bacterium]|nr:ferritin-like domain-containing protein [Candidatus Eremiobacteraeota bacterium]
MKIGSPEHRELFCRAFVETHRPFEPEQLPWPQLEGIALARLRAFPLWGYARSVEERAGRMVTAFANTVDDPVIRDAIALQGYEETRHGRLIDHAIQRYGVVAPPLSIEDAPADLESWMIFGFGECSDSILGFGALAIARQKKFFPQPLMEIFEHLLWEEARHIVFFINWWRYQRALRGNDGFLARTASALSYHYKAMAGAADRVSAGGDVRLPSFSRDALDPALRDVTPMQLLESALAENRKLMARFDPRLVRPAIVPFAAALLLAGLRALPPRAPAAAALRRAS